MLVYTSWLTLVAVFDARLTSSLKPIPTQRVTKRCCIYIYVIQCVGIRILKGMVWNGSISVMVRESLRTDFHEAPVLIERPESKLLSATSFTFARWYNYLSLFSSDSFSRDTLTDFLYTVAIDHRPYVLHMYKYSLLYCLSLFNVLRLSLKLKTTSKITLKR